MALYRDRKVRGFTLFEITFVLVGLLALSAGWWMFIRWLLDWNPIVPPYWQFVSAVLIINLVALPLPDVAKMVLNLAVPVAAYFYVSHLQATMGPAGAPTPAAAAAPAAAASPRFWLNVQGQTMGPYDLTMLQGFVRDGRVTKKSQLMKEGTSTWTTADQVPGLLR